MKRRGTVVTATGRCGPWIALDDPPGLMASADSASTDNARAGSPGWMLTDGSSMTPPLSAVLMKPHIVPVAEGTEWQVMLSGQCASPASLSLLPGAKLFSSTDARACLLAGDPIRWLSDWICIACGWGVGRGRQASCGNLRG